MSTYSKRWKLDNARGIKRYLDPAPTIRHVADLRAAGFSRKAIAEAAGVSAQTLTDLTRAPYPQYVTRPTAAKILAVRADTARQRQAPRGFVPAVGVRRRLQALQCLGHSAAAIADAAGVTVPVVHNIANQRGLWVTATSRDAVHRAYATLWARPGATPKVRTLALQKGWAPPLAWDDDTIDDPAAAPDLGDTGPRLARGRSKEDVAEDVAWLLEHEPLATAQQLGDRLGVTRDAVYQACRRSGRDDLHAQLTRNARLVKEGTAAA